MLPEFTREELAAGLDRVAEEVLEEAGMSHPPVDAFALADRLGIAVAWDDGQEGRARYVRLSGRRPGRSQATILVRPDPRLGAKAVGRGARNRRARGVSRLRCVGRRSAGNGAERREQAANQLAGRLLLPTRWFAADAAACGWDLLVLKARYNTASHELIARRMLECRPAVIISIFDHGRISLRRGNLPGRAPPPSPPEMECWRRVHRQCRPLRKRQGASVIQGWPIHEDGWKREILRLELR